MSTVADVTDVYLETLTAGGDDIEIVSETLHDALAFLEDLEPAPSALASG